MSRDEHDSLPLPLLAEYLRHTSFWDDWVPFLLDFPPFAERYQELLRLATEHRHADLELVAWDAPAAPGLLAELLALPQPQRLREVEADSRYRSWCLCHLLLRRCLEVTPDDPQAGEQLAEVAGLIAEHLPSKTCGHEPLAELKALAWAHRGNALRAQCELRQAATCFNRAFSNLGPLPANRASRAEIFAMHGGLLRDQRDFEGARISLQRALELFAGSGSPAGAARPLLILASLDYEVGEARAAVEHTRRALALLDISSQPRLFAKAAFNLATFLARAGSYTEARLELTRHRAFLAQHSTSVDQIRLRWCEAIIARGLDELAEAADAYQEARARFIEKGLGYYSALVTLELSTLYLEQGQTGVVRDLVREMLPIFRAQDIQREVRAVLILFQNAVLQETITVELARQLSGRLQKAGQNPSFHQD